MPIDLSVDNFSQTIQQTEGVILVDFWAPWCGPCKMMGPIIEQLAAEMSEVTFAKVNVDEESELASRHDILSIPTFVLFKDGRAVDQFAGAMPKEVLVERIKNHL